MTSPFSQRLHQGEILLSYITLTMVLILDVTGHRDDDSSYSYLQKSIWIVWLFKMVYCEANQRGDKETFENSTVHSFNNNNMTYLSFSVPKMDAKYSAILNQPNTSGRRFQNKSLTDTCRGGTHSSAPRGGTDNIHSYKTKILYYTIVWRKYEKDECSYLKEIFTAAHYQFSGLTSRWYY